MTATTNDDPLEPCADCGRVHERDGIPTCRGHVRRDGERVPCRAHPMRGGRVCRTHGGAAPQTRAAAARREADAHVEKVLRYAIGEVDPRHAARSPDEQLLEEVARSAQAVEWLAARVAELRVPDPAEGDGPMADIIGVDEDGEPVIAQARFSLYGRTHTGDLGIHPLWKKLDEERDRHARMARLAIDAGISERLVRLAEGQGRRIVEVLMTVIDSLELTPAQRDRARAVAGKELRKLVPGPAVIDVEAS